MYSIDNMSNITSRSIFWHDEVELSRNCLIFRDRMESYITLARELKNLLIVYLEIQSLLWKIKMASNFWVNFTKSYKYKIVFSVCSRNIRMKECRISTTMHRWNIRKCTFEVCLESFSELYESTSYYDTSKLFLFRKWL